MTTINPMKQSKVLLRTQLNTFSSTKYWESASPEMIHDIFTQQWHTFVIKRHAETINEWSKRMILRYSLGKLSRY